MKKTLTIGTLGGGQLERMLTQAAQPLGFKIIATDIIKNCPAAQVGAEEIVAKDGHDQGALNELAKRSDVITVTFEEFFDVNLLEPIAQSGKPVYPAPATLKLIKDKLRQKEFLQANRIAVGPFAGITSEQQAQELLEIFGGKMVIKTRQGGYDGNGNAVVNNAEEIAVAMQKFSGRPLYAEKFVPFTKELAVMVARSTTGETTVYPVVETRHERNICIEVLAPAVVPKNVIQKAEQLALRIVNKFESVGVFGIEMFLTDDDEVLINEIAPRVHNSGHYTVEACETSQFEQHLRAITGMPLGPTNLKVPAAVMINILGERNGPVKLEGLKEAEATTGITVHIYGKTPTKIDRKMGHITSTGKNIEEALTNARQARKLLSI